MVFGWMAKKVSFFALRETDEKKAMEKQLV
jgi:hypothetical protein